MKNRLLPRLDSGIKRLPFWEFHIGLALLLLTGFLNGLWLLVAPPLLYIEYHGATSFSGEETLIQFSTFWIVVRVELALVVAGFALLRRSGTGLLISLLSLLWLGAEYLRWHLLSRPLTGAGLSPVPEFGLHNLLFYGASNWHVAVLSIAAVLFVWELLLVAKAIRRTQED